MGAQLSYFEITSPNVEQAQAFYQQMFGWTVHVLPDAGGYGIVNTNAGENSIGGGIGASDRNDNGGVRIYFHKPDLIAALARAVELGGTVVQEPTDIPDFGTIAVFAAPDGNRIGLWDQAGLNAQ